MRFSSEQHARKAQALETAAWEESDPKLAAEYAPAAALFRICAKLASLEPRPREPVCAATASQVGLSFLK
jgi:hypothetical protein